MIIVSIHLIGFKKVTLKDCFKDMGYINVLYGGYKTVIKRLMYFSPPKECFYEDVLSNILHAILSEPLHQSV